MSRHRNPLDSIDYCCVCAEATGSALTISQYADAVCLCCGRVWGEDVGTCRGRHVNGQVWVALLDASDSVGNTPHTQIGEELNGCTITVDYSDGTSARWAVADEYGEALAVLIGPPDTTRL